MHRSFAYPTLPTHLLIFMMSTLFFLGCASSVKSDEMNYPLIKLHQVTNHAMKGAVLRKSDNNRIYFSKYHAPGIDINAGVGKKKERGQLVISIFGDSRPYYLVVLYRIEVLDGGKFSLDRYDKGIAQKYLDQINQYLASRPEDRDVIDDFRPY